MTASEQIIEVLNYICEKVGLAIDWTMVFASENVIPYIEQLCGKFITYEIATSVVWMVIAISFLLFAKWIFKKAKYVFDEIDDELGCLCYAISIVLIIICALVILCQTFDIVTCLTFPEKVLLEELKRIYNSIK